MTFQPSALSRPRSVLRALTLASLSAFAPKVLVALLPALLPALLFGCGDTETKPAALSVLKLKTPIALSATPLTGTVTLSWFGNNSESDFSGYNVYVAEIDGDTLAKTFGLTKDETKDAYSPITFKDEKDDEKADVRTGLSKYFNWDATKKANTPGGGKEFAPFVRCNVAKNDSEGACVSVKTTPAVAENRANGVVQFSFDTGVLSAEKTYAVFVAATKDDGEELASPTSNVLIVRPHLSVAPPAGVSFGPLSSSDVATGLSFAGGKVTKAAGTFPKDAATNAFCIPSETTAVAKSVHVYFQVIGTAAEPYVTGANGARVAELGPVIDFKNQVVTSALLESDQRDEEQVLLPSIAGTKASTAKPASNDLGATGGYGRCGLSRRILPAHLYAVAIPEGDSWRYAVIESPAASGLKDATKYRIVVGNVGERRL